VSAAPGNAPGAVTALLEEAARVRAFSAYQFALRAGGLRKLGAGGRTSYWPDGEPVDDATIFDIGSVTKVTVTATLVAMAASEGALDLDGALTKSFPELAGTAFERVTVADLLAHASGLVGWYPVFLETGGPGLDRWIAEKAPKLLRREPRAAAEYSDVGFLLLGRLVERVLGGDLATLFARRVATPWELEETDYAPRWRSVAATEWCKSRERLLVGEVFDENAAFLSRPTGHAGLFSTARDLGRWADRWLDAALGKPVPGLDPAVVKRMITRSGLAPGSTWCLGWDSKSPGASTAGERFSERAFGHLGFPGASVWIDPARECYAVLLTNRVHPSRFDDRIRAVRPRFHDAVAEWADACDNRIR
jgi:CubicO group peptidase (beta-lactamase class C family)